MSKIINDIVIVGGGSAGWMTASILIKDFPNKNIRLIESPNIPTIGVGESTFDGINYYFEYLGIDKNDFIKFTDASIKLGLRFKNFYKKDDTSFLYPFGRPYLEETKWGMQDWLIKKYKDDSIPVTDFAQTYFPVAHLIENNTFCDNKDGQLPAFDPRINTALNFDAQKFALWLKEKYAKVRGVKNILAEVIHVETDDDGIKYLLLDNGKKITADLYIDCTGFNSLLLGKSLNEEFIDYTNKLPNNSAWAVQIQYKDKNKEMLTVTTCTALKNGWVWHTPLYSRIGTGYVYSDKFTSDEDALKEFKEYLSSKDATNKRSKKEINNLNYNNLKMRVGIHKRTWVKNVAAIGLSAGFIEPLESNGLFTVHEFLFNLVSVLKQEKITSWNIHNYNEVNKRIYDSFVDFIIVHYCLSIRDDSEYWKSNSERVYSFDNIDKKKELSSNLFALYEMKTRTHDTVGGTGYNLAMTCIATGMNYFILDNVFSRIGEIVYNVDYSETMKDYFTIYDYRKNEWEKIAKESPTMYEYLKERYYND